jgi:hypothetical protein
MVQDSAPPLACKAASLIEKETLKPATFEQL